MEMLKTDLTKTDRTYYSAKKSAEIVELDSYGYLTIRGQSSPEDSRFLSAIETIYTVAYDIKFLCKAEDNDFTVPKMECHWYVSGGLSAQHQFTETPRNLWLWQIKIRMPDMVESDHFFKAIHQSREKKPDLNFDIVKFEYLKEGVCAQILHLGSYEEEMPSINKIHELLDLEGYEITGYHKEIYLNDPRRVAPEKLKTILRYQIEKK
ncbi:MAG: GyrI-like domain-containing protein [Marinoscillum sp.]